MNKLIEKITEKIQGTLHINEEDAQKILLGILILVIAISWFFMGNYLTKNKNDINNNAQFIPAEIMNGKETNTGNNYIKEKGSFVNENGSKGEKKIENI